MPSHFHLNERAQHYEGVLHHLKVIIPAAMFHNNTLAVATQICAQYAHKVEEIAHLCMTDEYFIQAYGPLSLQQVIDGLQQPIVYVYEHSGRLTYVAHSFDDDHIIDIEFAGILTHFSEVVIDG